MIEGAKPRGKWVCAQIEAWIFFPVAKRLRYVIRKADQLKRNYAGSFVAFAIEVGDQQLFHLNSSAGTKSYYRGMKFENACWCVVLGAGLRSALVCVRRGAAISHSGLEYRCKLIPK